MTHADHSLSLSSPTSDLDAVEKAGLAIVGLGVLALLVATFGAGDTYPALLLAVGVGGLTVGALMYFKKYLKHPAGINNDGLMFTSATARGALAWVLGVVFTGFYVLLYWFPQALAGLIAVFDPVADLFNYPEGVESRRWFMYGAFYTLAVVVMGVRMLLKYRHSRYHLIRTTSVMFFQLVLAFPDPVPPGSFQPARVLLLLLLAAQVRLPLAEHGGLPRRLGRVGRVHGVLGRRDDPPRHAGADLLLRQAVVLLVGLRLRRPSPRRPATPSATSRTSR